MPLNKLDNFIKNTEGRILYVNPNDLDATDNISNQGNSLAQPFKTIQRALLEAARFSYVKGTNNDFVEKTTILLFPGEHLIDNRPGYAIYDNGGAAYAVSRAGGAGVLASSVLSLGLDSIFDLTQEDNILYKFNSYYGGIVVPRGTSIVGLDLRKTKIRPKYVPNPTDSTVTNSAIFRITGACYFWQFSIFDGDETGLVYTNPTNYTGTYLSTPTFSHHKLTCFEFCDGVNTVGSYGLTDLDMYYSKVSNAYNAVRDIDQKFPVNPLGFAKQRPEWEIVGAFAADPITVSSIISGNGSVANSIVTVTTNEAHGLNAGTPIKVKGVTGSGVVSPYNISTKVQNVLSSTQFTYVLPGIDSYPTINPSPSASAATVTIETDTVSGASPYIFNISMRSVWGMNGLHADGNKASGFRSTVVAQFTAVSLQKDDRAFVKYSQTSRTYQGVSYGAVYGSALPEGASQTNSDQVYHLDSDAVYRSGWESSHIKISNDAFIQIVSVFAIGFNKHFDAESGGDASITNSNSNFGQISLNSSGFKREAFDKDNNAFITSIIPPRAINVLEEDTIEWLALNVGLTTQVGISSHLYLFGFAASDNPPSSQTQGYRIGARQGEKLYIVGSGTTYSANIYMCDNVIAASGITTALGTTSSVKSYDVSSVSSSVFTIGTHNLQTGEKVIIISDDGDLPENIEEHKVYYAVKTSSTQIQLATSYTNAVLGGVVTVYGGTNLHILSRVSDKESGDIGSPVQYDPVNSNWFIHADANNAIYSAFASGGTATFGTSTDLAYVHRIADERSLDEKLYKFRVVIPKELSSAKDPENGFVIQTSSSTGARNDADFTRTSIASTDYGYNKNPRFIRTCSVNSSTVTVISELPHNLQNGDIVVIRNVTSSDNTSGADNVGYNGRFEVTVTDDVTFNYSTTDTFGIAHTPGTFTNNVNTRSTSLPRFERNDIQGNFYIYRNEVISPYIYNTQDGIYHLYVLDASNTVPTEFTNLKYSQSPVNLYPQLDRDNVEANPPAAKSFAKRAPIGDVITNDLKNSITRESTDLMLKEVGIGLTISSVSSTSGIATITFGRNHGLAGIATGTITAGASYNDGTYYNVKILSGSQTGSWKGATARVTVSGGSVVSADIIASGSGYSSEALYFDQTSIGAGNGAARYAITTAGISTNVGDVVQFTGAGTTADGYYRISSVSSATQIAVAKTSGDPTILSSQYAFVVGPSIRITGTTYTSATGITTFTCASSHGLIAGNKFRVIDSGNNNLGDFLVKEKTHVTQFTAVTNQSISATNGYVLKHGLSSNDAISDAGGESIGTRTVPFYDSEVFTLTSGLTTGTTINISNSGIGTAQRLPLGSYVQVDNEIMRVISSNNITSATVIRGALGTRQENHDENSLIRKINPIAVEFRRPSILRASGHTFEYLGYGPGNYSTGLPQVQVKTLSEREDFLAQSQERSCGVVVYTAMNSNGDVFNGNTKTTASSGEVVSYDIPTPTVTGQDPSKLSAVFDEVTVKERLLVEGGASGQVLSQFDGPVNFNSDLRIKAQSTFSNTVRLTQGTQSTSTTTGDLIVSGGVGVAKNLNIGGNTSLTGTLTVNGGSGGTALQLNNGGDITFYNAANTGSASLFSDTNGELKTTDNLYIGGDLRIGGNDIKASDNSTAITLSGANVTIAGLINATTPNSGTTGGVRIGANAVTNTAYLQFISNNFATEYALLTANSSSLSLRSTSGSAIILDDDTQINNNLTVTTNINASTEKLTGNLFAWSTTTPSTTIGGLHLGSSSSTSNAGPAITFGARDSSSGTTAQAGIYINSDGSYGTRMYLATTDNYSIGSKVALSINQAGDVSATRGKFNINGEIGTNRTNALSVSGGNASSPIAAKSGSHSTVWGVLPWASGTTYLSSGTYYQNSAWVHASDNTYSCLFEKSGINGVRWYASSNSSGSWNLASAVTLWDSAGVWKSTINTTGAATVGSLTVTGATSLNTLGVSGAITGDSLGVTGAISGASLGVSGAVSGASLGISGAATLSSTLGVTSLITASGGISIGAGRDITGNYGTWTGEKAGKIQFHSNNLYLQYTTNLIGRDSAGNNRMTLDSSGNLTVSGDITAQLTSDQRLKDNITPIEDSLVKVLSISGNSYTWNEKSNKEGNDVGVIAQEVLEVLPEAVVTRDNGYLAVDYHKIVPLLVEAIKELSAKVENLEQKLTDK